jgi:hypothetical protein
MKTAVLSLLIILSLVMPMDARAEEKLPDAVKAQIHAPLKQVGSGTYRRFGFKVYVASLWAPDGVYDASKPYALQLRYTRSVSKDTMVDVVTGNIRDENVTDEATLASWKKVLDNSLTDVNDGDTLIGLARPGKDSELFFNGKKVVAINDQKFSQAFFNVWIGETADEDMRTGLMGKTE